MANFTPAGIVRIGRVPFDNSYRNTLAWSSKDDQQAYFSSVCDKRLEKGTYTYVRMNNSIRVAFNAEELYTYNYVMYQNANYGSKWFYAFIVGVNYVNKGCTELVLELDVMQTWFFDYRHNQCFVEREHVSDDGVGVHTNPEPQMPLDYVVKGGGNFNEWFQDWWLVVQTNAWPVYSESTVPDHTEPKVGGWYHNVFSGGKYYGYDPSDGDHDTESPNSIFWLLDALNRAGGAESISSMFMFPKAFAPSKGSDNGFEENTQPVVKAGTVTRPTSLGGGYVPRNNKLFTYPYTYGRFTDLNGNYKDMRFEYWEKEADGAMRFMVTSNLDPSATFYVTPVRYMGMDVARNEAFVFDVQVNCSWVYSAYQNWLAQNNMANMTSLAVSAATLMLPAVKGASAAAAATEARSLAAAGLVAGAKGKHARTRTAIANYERDMEAASATEASSGGLESLVGGLTGLSTIANIDRMSKVPSQQMGKPSGNSKFACGFTGVSFQNVVPRLEYALIVDKFFDMYGYQVDLVKRPNWNNRKSWNYIKCSGANHSGNVPAEDMARINAIYDQGFTYWHTPNVGDYTQDNSIVSR